MNLLTMAGAAHLLAGRRSSSRVRLRGNEASSSQARLRGGGEKTLADVPDADYFEACKLTDLMGVKAVQMIENAKA